MFIIVYIDFFFHGVVKFFIYKNQLRTKYYW